MAPYRHKIGFEWDEVKNKSNLAKHQVSFQQAQAAFADKKRLIYEDIDHSTSKETRCYCIGKIDKKICTVRFTFRNNKIRIFGAGYWRKERKIYEKENQ